LKVIKAIIIIQIHTYIFVYLYTCI